MALGIGIKEDEALALSHKLDQTSTDIDSLCQAIIQTAEAAESLTHTLNQNMVVRDYLVEVSAALKAVIPGVESVAQQLKAAAESGQNMKEVAEARALVQ